MPNKKILFANVPVDGHFNPLTDLAVYLKNKGHDVRWYAGNAFDKKLQQLAFPAFLSKKPRKSTNLISTTITRSGYRSNPG